MTMKGLERGSRARAALPEFTYPASLHAAIQEYRRVLDILFLNVQDQPVTQHPEQIHADAAVVVARVKAFMKLLHFFHKQIMTAFVGFIAMIVKHAQQTFLNGKVNPGVIHDFVDHCADCVMAPIVNQGDCACLPYVVVLFHQSPCGQ
ncbi:MAG: hypothetical protein LBQ81_01215 [Zoogloeaceae bacterium]|jgi:hypothetical protein|nr:hypothetical protein [Zoogloeaceae bacterium]